MNNQLAAVNLLINENANVNVKDDNGGKTPLMWGKYLYICHLNN